MTLNPVLTDMELIPDFLIDLFYCENCYLTAQAIKKEYQR